MLAANKSAIFERFFSIYNRHLLKRRFSSLHVEGFQNLLNKNGNHPLIIYCNHSSWWDGLVAFDISRGAGLDGYIMMEEKQLRKLFCFRLLGAFSVIREKPREAYQSIDYAAKLLIKDPNKTLWIFPQGEILPNDLRPLKFYNGLGKIVEMVKRTSITSLAIRYEFLGEFKPQIFVKIRQLQTIDVARNFNSKAYTNTLRDQLTESLDILKTDVLKRNFSEYETIF